MICSCGKELRRDPVKLEGWIEDYDGYPHDPTHKFVYRMDRGVWERSDGR